MLLDDIMRLIALLRRPTTDQEKRESWNSQIKEDYALYFEDLLAEVRDRRPLRYCGITRSLSVYGITGGSLYDLAMSIANHVTHLEAHVQKPSVVSRNFPPPT